MHHQRCDYPFIYIQSMNLTNKKLLAVSAAAIMLLPAIASAHTGGVNLNLGAALTQQRSMHSNTKADIKFSDDNGFKGKDNDNNKGTNEHATSTVAVNASTTAAVLNKKATFVSNVADFLGSISSNISARIAAAGLSASSTAAANAKLADYTTSTANAKVQAAAALTAAGNINANNATSTNAAFVVSAKTDLKAARDFLSTAKQDLMSIFHAIFNA
jgi:hypothetical protein